MKKQSFFDVILGGKKTIADNLRLDDDDDFYVDLDDSDIDDDDSFDDLDDVDAHEDNTHNSKGGKKMTSKDINALRNASSEPTTTYAPENPPKSAPDTKPSFLTPPPAPTPKPAAPKTESYEDRLVNVAKSYLATSRRIETAQRVEKAYFIGKKAYSEENYEEAAAAYESLTGEKPAKCAPRYLFVKTGKDGVLRYENEATERDYIVWMLNQNPGLHDHLLSLM